MHTFAKEPGESYSISLDFSASLPDGTALSSGVLSAVQENTGALATSTVLQGTTATIDQGQAILGVRAGTAGVDYVVTAVLTLDTGAVLVENLRMQVRSPL